MLVGDDRLRYRAIVTKHSAISLLVASVLVLTSAPRVAHAGDESDVNSEAAPVAGAAPSIDVLGVTAQTFHHARFASSPGGFTMATMATPDPIRLSSGAKTAIIVAAIVVGVLIIVGVVAIGKPHKRL